LVHGSDDKVSNLWNTSTEEFDVSQVTSPRASELLYQRLPARDKNIYIYQVSDCDVTLMNGSLMFTQGGYHELHNEPDGVKERLFEECITWVEAHLSPGISPKL
jgi:acylglycerol lipase